MRKRFTLLLSVGLLLTTTIASIALAAEPIDPNLLRRKADIDNGEAMYVTGKRKGSAALTFAGGPNWLHVEGGGCIQCHGKRGWGNVVPTFCTTKSPPITYKYLAGDGYPASARKDGRNPAYTMYSFKIMMRTGVKSNGYETDFCMPRYNISNKELQDLMGYLIILDDN